ncbi:diguanylate cyclase domain-containing protein [Microvirga arsenatis]|uniref:diguanylate cyclase n=1 Tax=Microvirga arsenatis TaxID=2692265 RepID=A0ABW9Z387_9HYPH|nr:GGDEF domain-containing protein [Microvirga arsenatis]NBJ13470.1 diguanylate cyclase [Microvirga arsenatis]NBJ26992.1 diguanylate cyclase [Microvirga arsenatis]
MGQAVYRLSVILISTIQAERDYEHRVRHDVLTGLPNRRFLMETREALAPHPVVLTITDIDHFKSINDTYRLRAGDAVLQGVGVLMTTRLSAYGMAGQLGGEELAPIAPRAYEERARTVDAICMRERAQPR